MQKYENKSKKKSVENAFAKVHIFYAGKVDTELIGMKNLLDMNCMLGNTTGLHPNNNKHIFEWKKIAVAVPLSIWANISDAYSFTSLYILHLHENWNTDERKRRKRKLKLQELESG